MADKIPAADMIEFGKRNIRTKITRYAELVNDENLFGVDIASRVKSWGKVKFEVYNKHPNDRGRLRFPILNLEVDNSENYFDMGGDIFPNGRSDLESTTIRVQILAIFVDGANHHLMDFIGQLREPEYTDAKLITLVVEHPLTVLTGRKWTRSDRIGGDTGIDEYFNS